MSDLENKFLELAEKREAAKQVLKDTQEEFDQLMQDIGVGSMFQDAGGVVYQIEVPKGSFISYPQIGYKRTRGKEGDPSSGGTFLGKKEAKENGFNV